MNRFTIVTQAITTKPDYPTESTEPMKMSSPDTTVVKSAGVETIE